MPEAGSDLDSQHLLLGYEIAMMATAAKYNLDDRCHRRHSNSSLVQLFFKLMEVVEIDLFVEAGAKEGDTSRRVKTKFPTARVVAFEANPYTYAQFQEINLNAGVEYLNLALSDHTGPTTFNVHRDESGAPIANGQASLLKREATRADIERGFIEVVLDGVALDEFFADQTFAHAAMWIDVEGACSIVLPGARDLLAKSALVMIEVEEQPFWGAEQWLRGRVANFLFDLGFVPVARDFEYAHQYNIVFVHSAVLNGANKVFNELGRFMSQVYAGPERKPLAAPVPDPPARAAAPAPVTLRRRLRRRAGRIKRAVWRLLEARISCIPERNRSPE